MGRYIPHISANEKEFFRQPIRVCKETSQPFFHEDASLVVVHLAEVGEAALLESHRAHQSGACEKIRCADTPFRRYILDDVEVERQQALPQCSVLLLERI